MPKRVNVRLTALFDHLRDASRFNFQEFHDSIVVGARGGARSEQKSPPENYGKKDQTTVAAVLPWRDL